MGVSTIISTIAPFVAKNLAAYLIRKGFDKIFDCFKTKECFEQELNKVMVEYIISFLNHRHQKMH